MWNCETVGKGGKMGREIYLGFTREKRCWVDKNRIGPWKINTIWIDRRLDWLLHICTPNIISIRWYQTSKSLHRQHDVHDNLHKQADNFFSMTKTNFSKQHFAKIDSTSILEKLLIKQNKWWPDGHKIPCQFTQNKILNYQ